VTHGFLRAPNGTIFTFAEPSACTLCATLPQSINPAGDIAGYYSDHEGAYHGFLLTP
jgi:hypothetical protein